MENQIKMVKINKNKDKMMIMRIMKTLTKMKNNNSILNKQMEITWQATP